MELPRSHHRRPGKEGTSDHIEMATISFGGAPGVYINEVAGQSATPAIAAFSTTYMLVEVDAGVPTTLFPFNKPVQVTNTREYVRLIGGVIPTTKIELLSYQCVDAFFAQCYVGDLRVIRVGTPANIVEVQFNPSGFKTNGLGVSTPLEAGDVVYAQLLINGARLGEFTASGTWKGVKCVVPVDYIEGNFDNNKKIAIAIRDAVSLAIAKDPNVSAGTIVRDEGVCQDENAECAYLYLAGREFNAPVSVVPESQPPSDGAYYVFTSNTYTVGPVVPGVDNINELVADYLQCLRTAFVDEESQGYLTAPCAFAKFGPEGRRLVGQEMAFQAELNSHKWMAIADAGPYLVTDVLAYQNFLQHAPAAPLVTGQEFLVGNTIYQWTAENTDYTQLAYAPLSANEPSPEYAVNKSKNLNVPVDKFLSLRDDGIYSFGNSTSGGYDKPSLLALNSGVWPATKEVGTPVSLSDCNGPLADLNGETVYVVPTYLNPGNKNWTQYFYIAATYPEAVSAYNWVVARGGLDFVVTAPPGVIIVDDQVTGELGDAVTGVNIDNPGSGYEVAPAVTFSTPADPDGRTAEGFATLGTSGQVNRVQLTNAGMGYTNQPEVNIIGDGTNALAQATVATVNGEVVRVQLLTGGLGYTAAPTVGITPPAALGGTTATAQAVLAVEGSVASLALGSGGQFYTAAPEVVFSGPGAGATATAALNTVQGKVARVDMTDGGSDYQGPPTVSFTGAGTNAAGVAVLGTVGAVSSVAKTAGGLYLFPPTATVAGGTTPAQISTTLVATGSAVEARFIVAGTATLGSSGQITLQGEGTETNIICNWSTTIGGQMQVALISGGTGWTQTNATNCIAGTYGTFGFAGAGIITQPTLRVEIGRAIDTFTIDNGGAGYTQGGVNLPLVITPSPLDAYSVPGSGNARIGFPIVGVTVTNPGTQYTTATTVAFAPLPGDTGKFAAGDVLVGFPVQTVTLDTGGYGYTGASSVSFQRAPGDTTGSGAQIALEVGYGISDLILLSGGTGYTAADVVNVSFSGPGTEVATAAAYLGFPISSINVSNYGDGYSEGQVEVQIVPNSLDLLNRLSPAEAEAVLGFPVAEITLTDSGSGYDDPVDPALITVGDPEVGTDTCTATASLQLKGTGILTYEDPAWDLYVEIDGQTSDLILNATNTELDINTLHLPGTLQNPTSTFNLSQFTRTFVSTDISNVGGKAVFNCLNHGLVSGSIVYFTETLTKATGGSFVTRTQEKALVQYYVSVLNGNQFLLATTLTNLNARNYLAFPSGGLAPDQTSLCYSTLLIAPENTNLYNNEGVVNLVRGRKYGFNTLNVRSQFYPASVDPATGPDDEGTEHQLGFYRSENQPDPRFYSAYGEFNAGTANPNNAGFLGDLVLQSRETVNFFCVPLVANERADQAYITPTWTGPLGVKKTLWGASLQLRYTAYQEAPSSLWRFNAITSNELVDYALRGTFNEGVPACVQIATGIDDAQKLLEDSQQYFNARGFIAYYGPYLKNASGAWLPPSPYVTGVAIRRYRSEGFQYPPAGVKYPLNGVSAVQVPINSTQQDILNPKGCNVCRTLPGYGSTVFIWGGRTRINQDDAEQRLFQFVNTRVIMNVVYGSLRKAFDSQIFNVIDGFGLIYNKIISIGNSILNELYVRGALFGSKPGQAFQVICDERIQTTAALESGIVNAKVFVVPVPTLERIEVDLIRVAIGNMQNELDALGVGQDNAI